MTLKIFTQVPLTPEEISRAEEVRRNLARMPLCDLPFTQAFVASSSSGAQNARNFDDPFSSSPQLQGGGPSFPTDHYTLQIVDVADIYVVPVCVTHRAADDEQLHQRNRQSGEGGGGRPGKKRRLRGSAGGGHQQQQQHLQHPMSAPAPGDDEDDEDGEGSEDGDGGQHGSGEKITGFWMVMLKTRKCYNFCAHLHWLVNLVDKKDKNNIKRLGTREYDDVMSMLRDVIMYQYEQSPNAVAFFRTQVCFV